VFSFPAPSSNNPSEATMPRKATQTLTEMQQQFVLYRVRCGMNRTEAARLAGFKWPSRVAYQLEQSPKIMARIRNERNKLYQFVLLLSVHGLRCTAGFFFVRPGTSEGVIHLRDHRTHRTHPFVCGRQVHHAPTKRPHCQRCRLTPRQAFKSQVPASPWYY